MKSQTANTIAPPQRRVTKTRSALNAALLFLLKEKSFEQISVKEVAARANVSYRTFFRHYPDKETLLHNLIAQELQELLAMTLPILDSVDSRASIQALCAYVWKHRKLWEALLTGGASTILKEEYLSQALKVAKEKSDPHSWVPEDLAVLFTVTASIDILTWWLKQPEPISIDEVAKYLNGLAIEPVFTNPYRYKPGDRSH